ncbi:hypothetical protein A6K76_14335 [Caryophanon latum]|uniref:Uncharacterized protein n=1 Tax=Caryophanon latum TaxID=33977 RepID=A0A1C0YI22_9BACL|nr:hypothetical protein A6K76_14335 [Caryophanon latum]
MSATSMWHHLHDQHRVRRRAPGIYLPRVTAEAKRAAIRELPVEWLINTLELLFQILCVCADNAHYSVETVSHLFCDHIQENNESEM